MESICLTLKDTQNGLGNGFNKRGIGLIEVSKVSKVYYLS